jgi:hypothetical protein
MDKKTVATIVIVLLVNSLLFSLYYGRHPPPPPRGRDVSIHSSIFLTTKPEHLNSKLRGIQEETSALKDKLEDSLLRIVNHFRKMFLISRNH